MIKILFTWKRNPDLTEEQCEQHYRTFHTELVKKAVEPIRGFRRYVQNKVVGHMVYNYDEWGKPVEAEPDFDRFVEMYFDSREALEQALNSPGIRAGFEDAENFANVKIPESIKVYEIIEEIPLEKKGD